MLFAGAGFSHGARNHEGQCIPLVSELRDLLWDIAFPGRAREESSSLGDTYAVAVRQNETQVRQLLEGRLTVDPAGVPDYYERWFAAPWTRIYTVNLDTLEEAVSRRFDLPREIEVVSGFDDESAPTESSLQSVHLNGRLTDFPATTFSFRQYGERTARRDYWYHQLVRQMNGQAVVFVGTTLDEPPLWQHLELRGKRGRRVRELRPGSYLVSPSLPAARAAMLEEFNIDWIEMDAEEFAVDVLARFAEECEAGLRIVARREAPRREDQPLRPVSELRLEAAQDTREYLLGREPVFADFGDEGYAITRMFEDDLLDSVNAHPSGILLVTGTAGSGKSSTLMRLGLRLDAAGRDVRWLNIAAETTARRIRAAVNTEAPDVVLVDDIDIFGSHTGPLLADLGEDSPDLLVVAAVRSSRYERLELAESLNDLDFREVVVPHLADDDIEVLLEALSNAGRLGALRGLTPLQQRETLQRKSNRQLLVAMIEATSGQRFDEKVESECADLGPAAGLLYAVIAIATSLRHPLTRHEVLLAGDASNETLNVLQGLVDRHLVVQDGEALRVRHRMIAERAVDWYRTQGQLLAPISGVLFAMATAVSPPDYTRTRPGRILARVMNHQWLRQMLNNNQLAIREAYDGVQHLLDWDAHYWLQRGSFEVEIGDIVQAENFLEQARSLAPEDYRVQTEWAYMVLVRATQNAADTDSRDRVEEAFAALEDAIDARGQSDAYPFHVMGLQGLNWLRESSEGPEEGMSLLARLRYIANEGLRLHPRDPVLRQLERDLEAAYLALGAIQADPGA
jgi:hypothetical protein